MKMNLSKSKRMIVLCMIIVLAFCFSQFIAFSAEGEEDIENIQEENFPLTLETISIPEATASEGDHLEAIPTNADDSFVPAAPLGIQAASAQTIVIDLSAPEDPMMTEGYFIFGYEFRIMNPDYHYIIRNAPPEESCIHIGGGTDVNDHPGNYKITLENATISAGQSNLSPISVGAGSQVELELVGTNKITYRDTSAYDHPLIYVPENGELVITGDNGTLFVSPPKFSSTTSVVIGGDNGGAFGNITIDSGTIEIDNSTTGASAALGGNGDGNITIQGGTLNVRSSGTAIASNTAIHISGSNTLVTAYAGVGCSAIDGKTTGTIDIDEYAHVTAYGGANAVAINGERLAVSWRGDLNAYAQGAYAISDTMIYDGNADLINAYVVANDTEGTFQSLSDTSDTPIICTTPGIVLPMGYTSFSYNAYQGEYTHQYQKNDTFYELFKLADNDPKVATQQNLTPVPLATPTEKTVVIEYYFYDVLPEFKSMSVSLSYLSKGKPLDDTIIQEVAGEDWKLAGILSGYNKKDVYVEDITISEVGSLVQVVYGTYNTPYTVAYYKDTIAPNNLLGTEQKTIETNNKIITQQQIMTIADAYKPLSQDYSNGEWVQNNNVPMVGDMTLTWNPSSNTIYILYTQKTKMPLSIHYYIDNILTLPIKTIESSSSIVVGTQLDDKMLENLFGTSWKNDCKPSGYYEDGQVIGVYPVISSDVSQNAISVVYTKANSVVFTVQYYSDGISQSNLLGKVHQSLNPSQENISTILTEMQRKALYKPEYYNEGIFTNANGVEIDPFQPKLDQESNENVFYMLYTKPKEMPFSIEYYKNSVTGTILGKRESSRKVAVGKLLTTQQIDEEFGTTWVNVYRPSSYNEGQIENYPTIEINPNLNVVKVVYHQKNTSTGSDERGSGSSYVSGNGAGSVTPGSSSSSEARSMQTLPNPGESTGFDPVTPTENINQQPTLEENQASEVAPSQAEMQRDQNLENLVETDVKGVFEWLDDDGNHLGYVKMSMDEEGNRNWQAVDENGNPLGLQIGEGVDSREKNKENPKTLDGSFLSPFITLVTLTGSVVVGRYFRRRH